MKAEIISIGTELLLGHTINTDAAIVARQLAELGFDLTHMQIVGDNAERLADALALAGRRSQIIITTGGLGPTDDDLSKETVAKFAGRPLEENAVAKAALAEYFGERPMSANQARQAWLPKGCIMLKNSIGTAPGCIVPFGESQYVIMFPGPPGELETMLKNEAAPFLARFCQDTIYSTILRTFGIGEGSAALKIRDLMAQTNPTVAPYAQGGEMFIKITAKAASAQGAQAMCRPLVDEIMARLGDVVYGRDVGSLEEVVLKGLIATGRSVATAESCTGGLLAKRITDLPGASAVFQLGLVTYANEAKEKILGVPGELIEKYGAVSSQVAESMASNAARLAGSWYGIGITGIAGPEGATPQKPLGLVYIGLLAGDEVKIREIRPFGRYLGRDFTRQRAASHALDMLRRDLVGLPEPLVDGKLALFTQTGNK